MPSYESTYIAKDTDIDNVIEIFGSLLHQLNYIMNNMDSQNVKRINTNSTSIKSADGATEIDGSQLIMYDANGKKRVVLGKNKSGAFEFSLYKPNGATKALELSSAGDAFFRGKIEASDISGGTINGAEITGGTINVDTDVSVGDNIYIGSEDDASGTKSIAFFDSGSTSALKKGLITATKDNTGLVTMTVTAGKIKLNTLSDIDAKILLGNYKVVTTNMQGYVIINDTEYTVHWR